MRRYKKRDFGALGRFCYKTFPNPQDNLKQILIKLSYIFVTAAMICSLFGFGIYYGEVYKQQRLINTERALYSKNDPKTATSILSKRNSDYVGWLSLPETQLNYPIYKARDNSFYLNRNSEKKNSKYGSLFLDSEMDIRGDNRVIYGNSAKDGMMFSILEKYRNLKFYKENYKLSFCNGEKNHDYIVYAVFVMNSKASQDGGNIYDIRFNDFSDERAVSDWISDAKERSIIKTEIDVTKYDKIITLVTTCEDFEDARLVVMARQVRSGEMLSSINRKATPNTNPKYPKIWYENRNIKYPF